jgi:hypothetical protein
MLSQTSILYTGGTCPCGNPLSISKKLPGCYLYRRGENRPQVHQSAYNIRHLFPKNRHSKLHVARLEARDAVGEQISIQRSS